MNNTAGALLGALALVAVTLGGGGLAWGGAERAAPAVIKSDRQSVASSGRYGALGVSRRLEEGRLLAKTEQLSGLKGIN